MTHRTPLTAVAVAVLLLITGCGAGSNGQAAAAPGMGAAAPDPAAAPSPGAPVAAGQAAAVGPVAGASASAGSWDVSQLPDPCLTINRDQVTAATGLSVTAGVPLDSWPPLCSFTIAGPAAEYLYVSSDPRATSHDDFVRERSDSQATRSVAGIGNDAYWLPEFTALHVYRDRGTTHLTVKFSGSAAPKDAQAKAVAVAKVALR